MLHGQTLSHGFLKKMDRLPGSLLIHPTHIGISSGSAGGTCCSCLLMRSGTGKADTHFPDSSGVVLQGAGNQALAR